MPSIPVNLDLRAPGFFDPAHIPAGWAATTGTTGYIYKFAGGNFSGHAGGFSFAHGAGVQTVSINLIADPRYSITDVHITYDGNPTREDLSIPDSAKTDRTWTITDSDLDAESGYFEVTIKFAETPTSIHTGIVCDPRWQNT